MTMISKLSFKDIIDLQSKIKCIENDCDTLSDAAQRYMSILYDELEESMIYVVNRGINIDVFLINFPEF